MEQKIYYGQISADDLTNALLSNFNCGNFSARQVSTGQTTIIQVATNTQSRSGGHTSISIILQECDDGVIVNVGKQAWLGVAASLGETVFTAIRNPFNLLKRLDDIAQDIESLQMTENIWKVIDNTSEVLKSGQQLSEKLRTLVCNYCETSNPLGEPNCIACGAPLGPVQPITCPNCGVIVALSAKVCINCDQPLG